MVASATACFAAAPSARRHAYNRAARAKSRRVRWVVPTAVSSPQAAGTAEENKKNLVLIIPGFLSSADKYEEMAGSLRKYPNFSDVAIVPLTTSDWYPTLAGGDFSDILNTIDEAANDLLTKTNENKIEKLHIVGHSAGGWLARCWLGSEPYQGKVYAGAVKTQTLLTLGTPHYSLELYPFGRIPEKLNDEVKEDYGGDDSSSSSSSSSSQDEYNSVWTATRGKQSTVALTNFRYPGCFEKNKGVRYVSVCGSGVVGSSLKIQNLKKKDFLTRAGAGVSYAATCGECDVDGDSVTPVVSSILQGSDELILPGVTHNPPDGGNGTKNESWYGSDDVIERWVDKLL